MAPLGQRSLGALPRVIAVVIAVLLLLVAVQPRSEAATLRKPPTTATVYGTASTRLGVTFSSVRGAAKYRIAYATNSAMKGAKRVETRSTRVTLKGLKAATTYYVRVKALKSSGASLTSYRAAIKGRTLARSSSTQLVPATITTKPVVSGLTFRWPSVGKSLRYELRIWPAGAVDKTRVVRTTSTSTTVTGLQPGTKYGYKLRIVSSSNSARSSYTTTATVTTAGTAPVAKPPTLPPSTFRATTPDGLTATADGTTLKLSWVAKPGNTYRIAYSTAADMAGSRYADVATNAHTLTGLVANTAYYLKVKVLKPDGTALAPYSPALKAQTGTVAAPMRVASYNIRCTNCVEVLDENEEPWEIRRPFVAATIRAQKLAVVGLQEASQSRLIDANGEVTNVSQFEDLLAELKAPWKAVNKARYNCLHPSTMWKCEPMDQGASKGNKIAYDSSQVTPLRNGSLLLPKYADTGERYAVWAEFRHIASGKDFFFVTTHLESKGDPAGSTLYYELRVKQMQAIIAMIKRHNTRALPTVLTGDWNSQKWTEPANGPYDVAVKAGYVDPLGNTYRSKVAAPTATVEKRIRTEYASGNGFRRLASKSTVINGTYLDYILTTPRMRVAEWETVVKVDALDNFVGVIPSDHNMIRATVYLP